MQHTIIAYVEDKPGVLTRIATLFRKRGLNIESLTVSKSEQPGKSRITIMLDGALVNAERLVVFLDKLVNVIRVELLTGMSAVYQDLVLVKVNSSPEEREPLILIAEETCARIMDINEDSIIFELTGTHQEIDSFLQKLTPFGILETARSGAVAIQKCHPVRFGEHLPQTEEILLEPA